MLVGALPLLAYAAYVVAQTPPGFNPSTNQNLSLNFNGQTYSTPGAQVSPNAVSNAPSVTGPVGLNESYLLLMVNPDAPPPPDASSPEFIHWIQPNVVSDASGSLSSNSAPFKDYLPPAPIASESPQHFIVLLFQQPNATFTVPAYFSPYSGGNPTGFNTSKFASQADLRLVAGNYVLVTLDSGSSSTSTVPSSSRQTSAATAFKFGGLHVIFLAALASVKLLAL